MTGYIVFITALVMDEFKSTDVYLLQPWLGPTILIQINYFCSNVLIFIAFAYDWCLYA